MSGGAEAIKVAVRVRPFNDREKELKSTLCVSMQGPNTTVTDPNGKPKTFTFDFSYWSHDTKDSNFADQDTVMKDIGNVILQNSLNGFNGCLFAYGQTGSGKSYSVMGYGDAPGIIPRSVDKIFEEKRKIEGDPQKELEVFISYVEIYNEHVRDLLHAGTGDEPELKITDHPKWGVYIPGLTEQACSCPDDVQKLMDFGTKKRVVAATQMNATSSRSHAVFTVKVVNMEGKKPDPGAKDERKALNAKINLVDLAGSERQSKTGAEGSTLKEGCAINQSLSALGLVIKELAEAHSKKGGKEQAVPFRASKLTFLLKSSLAGNSKTYMIAAISPASDNREETVSTLRFASSVKMIKTVATQNKDKKDEMIDSLQEEIKNLRAQMKAGGIIPVAGGGTTDSRAMSKDEAKEEIQERERLLDEMKTSYEEKLAKAKEMETSRSNALADQGLSTAEINQAFGVGSSTPYLLNMADDPMLAGCLLYFIVEDKPTTIGSEKSNTIALSGIGVPEKLCQLLNVGNEEVTIEKVSSQGRVVINGKLLKPNDKMSLRHGDKIFLGRAYALKLTLPQQAAGKEEDKNVLSLHGLEDEWSALEDSPLWSGLSVFLDDMLRQMPPDQGKKLFEDVKEGCMLCDEANEITGEIRPEDCLHFEVDLTTSFVPFSVVVRILHSSNGRGASAEDWRPLYTWPVSSMRGRLERMRDCYEQFKRKGTCQVDALTDPWHEPQYEDIHSRLLELEMALSEALETNARLKTARKSSMGKTLMIWQTDKGEKALQMAFNNWVDLTKSMRALANKRSLQRAGSRTLAKRQSSPRPSLTGLNTSSRTEALASPRPSLGGSNAGDEKRNSTTGISYSKARTASPKTAGRASISGPANNSKAPPAKSPPGAKENSPSQSSRAEVPSPVKGSPGTDGTIMQEATSPAKENSDFAVYQNGAAAGFEMNAQVEIEDVNTGLVAETINLEGLQERVQPDISMTGGNYTYFTSVEPVRPRVGSQASSASPETRAPDMSNQSSPDKRLAEPGRAYTSIEEMAAATAAIKEKSDTLQKSLEESSQLCGTLRRDIHDEEHKWQIRRELVRGPVTRVYTSFPVRPLISPRAQIISPRGTIPMTSPATAIRGSSPVELSRNRSVSPVVHTRVVTGAIRQASPPPVIRQIALPRPASLGNFAGAVARPNAWSFQPAGNVLAPAQVVTKETLHERKKPSYQSPPI